MKRLFLVLTCFLSLVSASSQDKAGRAGRADRAYWVNMLDKISRPVILNLSEGSLRENMPVECRADLSAEHFKSCTYLEAFGRTVDGLASWLELGPDESKEGRLRSDYIKWTCEAIANGVNPESPDHLNFNKGSQPLVDAAFLCHGLLRAPTQLWGNLDDLTKERLVFELKSTRVIAPGQNNWLLFSAMVEAALLEFTGECEVEPIRYAVRKMEEWYVGDGQYSDGVKYHFDYYNSYVIHPMLLEVLNVAVRHGLDEFDEPLAKEKARYVRYAVQQERMIAPDGTYPVVGRSIIYRFGAFQVLAEAALNHNLPAALPPSQVRSALTAVIKRQLIKGSFDKDGWLNAGFAGHQPDLMEYYSSTGSLYLCSVVFLPLGLPEDDPFWTGEAMEWTNLKIWNGDTDVLIDGAIKD